MILKLVLTKLNHCLASSSRKVLLLMDNAGCHPEDLKDKYSNIKIVFLPANTTSKLQPLDLGIIQSFKVHYRQMFLQYVLARIDQCASATDVLQNHCARLFLTLHSMHYNTKIDTQKMLEGVMG